MMERGWELTKKSWSLVRYATDGEVAAPFDVDHFQAAFKPGSRRGLLFWRKP